MGRRPGLTGDPHLRRRAARRAKVHAGGAKGHAEQAGGGDKVRRHQVGFAGGLVAHGQPGRLRGGLQGGLSAGGRHPCAFDGGALRLCARLRLPAAFAGRPHRHRHQCRRAGHPGHRRTGARQSGNPAPGPRDSGSVGGLSARGGERGQPGGCARGRAGRPVRARHPPGAGRPERGWADRDRHPPGDDRD